MIGEIKGCPWCGAEMKVGSEEPFFSPDRRMFYLYHSHPYPKNCPFHKGGNLSTDFFDTEKEAMDAWMHGISRIGVNHMTQLTCHDIERVTIQSKLVPSSTGDFYTMDIVAVDKEGNKVTMVLMGGGEPIPLSIGKGS